MPTRWTRFAFVALTVVLATWAGERSAWGLDPAKRISQYSQQAWVLEDGLPQNTVQRAIQTRDGYIWLGTQEGLVRFDGTRFAVFEKANTPASVSYTHLTLPTNRE